jgi:DNA gyrase subunit A
VIRQNVRDIKIISRNTSGVRLIRLDQGDKIADVARVISENGDEE